MTKNDFFLYLMLGLIVVILGATFLLVHRIYLDVERSAGIVEKWDLRLIDVVGE